MSIITLVLCFFMIEVGAEIGLGFRPLLAKGLSLKNLILYLFFMGLLTQIFLRRDFERIKSSTRIHLAFFSLIVCASVSILYNSVFVNVPHYNVEHAINALKGGLIDSYLVFLIYSYFIRTEKQAHFLFRFFVFFMIVGSLITIIGVYIHHVNVFGFDVMRPNGPMGEPNQTGAVLALFIPFSVGMLLGSKGIERLYYVVGAGVMFAALVLTSSRGGLLGMLFGLAVLLWLIRERVGFGKVVFAMGIVPLIFMVGWLLAPQSYQSLLLSRIGFLAEKKIDWYHASAGRIYIWSKGIKEWLKSPILGFGWASFNFLTRHTSHNTFLEVLISVGVVGLVLYMSIFVGLLRRIRLAISRANGAQSFYLHGIIAGLSGLLISVFFVNLYRPWYFVWAFLGVSLSFANIILKSTE